MNGDRFLRTEIASESQGYPNELPIFCWGVLGGEATFETAQAGGHSYVVELSDEPAGNRNARKHSGANRFF
jgi:hypothetical protein